MQSFVFASLILAAGASARTFTVANKCTYTVWPAMFTDLNVGQNIPSFPTGWEALPNTQVQFPVPDDWKAGRIWGRRGCDFTQKDKPDYLQCMSGGCNGGLLCDPHSGTGVPPASVAEWTLAAGGDADWYDVSLVDGFNVPMAITNNAGCAVADCAVDLSASCPDRLRGQFNATGAAQGCNSACNANLDGNQANSPNCCSGDFNTPAKCPHTGVAHYSFFKQACPNSYAYAYDESSTTALWTCPTNLKADFTLTFCP
ncbi:thaumatin-like protein [Crepidotus variabilis]|uniref:Thaumatin-like protein n=1 Tax=Crepidotus variabilis TaxID=179855 RepID=A0A9P6EA68_9AGAR|nr:thaumatin-like protein [Crepidotus variabilis]